MKEDIDGLIKKLNKHYLKYNKYHNLNISSSIFSRMLNLKKLESFHYRKILIYSNQVLNYSEKVDKNEIEYIYKKLKSINTNIIAKTNEKNIKNLDFDDLNYCLSQVKEISLKKCLASSLDEGQTNFEIT